MEVDDHLRKNPAVEVHGGVSLLCPAENGAASSYRANAEYGTSAMRKSETAL
jgi:hypothetical protein